MIGDPSTDFVCIPNTQFGDDDLCPSGTHEAAQADGTYQCVAPSGVACAGLSDLDACTYNWGNNSISGTCYQGACLEDCSIDGDDCNNGNSVCQATGVISDPSTDFVCIPSNQFAAAGLCPSGTHEVAQADGTYQCVAPSGVACAGKSDLAACGYTWGDNSISGTCYQGACLEDCSIAGNDCGNSNSVCQATGVIGLAGTDFVCVPSIHLRLITLVLREPMSRPKRTELTSALHQAVWPVLGKPTSRHARTRGEPTQSPVPVTRERVWKIAPSLAMTVQMATAFARPRA